MVIGSTPTLLAVVPSQPDTTDYDMHDRILIVMDSPNQQIAAYQGCIDRLLTEASRLLFVPQHLLVVNEPYQSRREHEAIQRAEFEKRLRDAAIAEKVPELPLEPAPTCPPHEWGQRRHRRPALPRQSH